MQALIDAKRRIYQTAVEKLGNGERMAKDEEEYKLALERFRELEVHYRQLYDVVRSTRVAMGKLAERNLATAEAFDAFFSAHSADEQTTALSQSALHTSARDLDILHASASKVIEVHALFPLERVLREQIPDLKRRIVDHKNFETDVSSYHRRLTALLQKRPESDPEVVKQREKYSQADELYTRHHTDLLRELRQLDENKLDFIRPVYECVLVAHGERLKLQSAEWNANLKDGQQPEVREEMAKLVKQGVVLPPSTDRKQVKSVGYFTKLVGKKTAMPPPPPPPPSAQSQSQSQSTNQPQSPPPAPSSRLPPPGQQVRSFHPGCVCVAHTSYVATDEGDLALQVGDRVVMREELNPGWWVGALESNPDEEGLFPDTYVSVAVD